MKGFKPIYRTYFDGGCQAPSLQLWQRRALTSPVALRTIGALVFSSALFSTVLFSTVLFAEDFESPAIEANDDSSSVLVLEPAARLDDIDRQVVLQEEKLVSLREKRASVGGELKRMRSQTSVIESEQQALEKQRQEHLARVEELKVEVLVAEEEERALERRSRERLRALYIYRPAQLVAGLFDNRVDNVAGTGGSQKSQGSSVLTVGQATYLFSKVSQADRELLGELRRSVEERIRLQGEVQLAVRQVESVKAELERRRAMIHARRVEQERLGRDIDVQTDEIETQLVALRAEALRLENVVVSLMGGVSGEADQEGGVSEVARASMSISERRETEGEPRGKTQGRTQRGWKSDAGRVVGRSSMTEQVPLNEDPQIFEEKSSGDKPNGWTSEAVGAGRSGRISGVYAGVGIRAQRKQLAQPAKGTVIRAFGKQRHEEFKDIIFRRGVELAVVNEREAHSIAPGRVTFSGELPGFGKVVLIDHGNRSHSLYGRLGVVLVDPGQEVDRGQAVAELIETDRRGSNLYFEIRENGAPVNPRVFFPNL